MNNKLILIFTAIVVGTTPLAAEKEEKNTYEESIKRKEKIITTLDYGISSERMQAITMIPAIADKNVRKDVLAHLAKVLKEELDTEILIRGMTFLNEEKIDMAVDTFLTHLDHRSEDVQIAAVYGLKSIKAAKSTEKLVDMLKNSDMTKNSTLIEALLRTLGDFKVETLVPWAVEQIQDGTTGNINREFLVLFLGETGGKEADKILVELFRDEGESVTIRSFAVNALSKRNVRSVIPEIKEEVETIESYSFQRRQQVFSLYMHCIGALVRFGDDAAYPRLMNSMRSDNAGIRRRATTLLKELKDKRSIDILKYKMNHDPDTMVRKLAKEALEEMGVKLDDDEKK